MYHGFLSLDGSELGNTHRVAQYVRSFLPNLYMADCESCDSIRMAFEGTAAYVDPATDGAPWYLPAHPDTAKFYGFYPTLMEGLDDSTRTVEVTQVTYDGAVHSRSRHESGEVRVKGLMIAQDQDGLTAGMAWLRDVLDNAPCGQGTRCVSRTAEVLTNCPGAATEAEALTLLGKYRRTLFEIEILDAPRVTKVFAPSTGAMVEVEFVLSIGVPGLFREIPPIATTSGLTPQTAAEVYCDVVNDPYEELLADPNATAVPAPPRPPNIEPVAMPSSWNRYTVTTAAAVGEQWGRVVPSVTVSSAGSALRNVRVRYYRQGSTDSCDYEGEYMISYVPPNSLFEVDGVRRRAQVQVGGTGEFKPANHLLYGSHGRPVTWPSLSCHSAITVVVDTETALNGGLVLVEAHVKE